MSVKRLLPQTTYQPMTQIHKKIHDRVEFSFGKGIGNKIYHAINSARHSVFILTPYISQGYIDFLLRKKDEGVNVSLVTTSDAQKGKLDEICKKIVIQHRTTDEVKLALKNKSKRRCLFVAASTFFLGIVGLFWHGAHHHFHNIAREMELFTRDESVFILACVGIIFFSIVLYNKYQRERIFNYSYSTKFPFTVIPSIYSNDRFILSSTLDSFVHAKIFVIDNKDIFIGSANFTSSGLRQNIESFVKISDPEAAEEITSEVSSYIEMNCDQININYLGKHLYYEALY